MGYTHYWKIKPMAARRWAAILGDAQKLLDASPVPLVPEGFGANDFIFDDKIGLNGAEPDDYETFVLKNDHDDSFCKTGRMPYDVVVCGLLIVAAHHGSKQVDVWSDGGMDATYESYAGPHDKEWDDALAFVHRVLGPGYKLPIRITDRLPRRRSRLVA